jgi:hypothetical protein
MIENMILVLIGLGLFCVFALVGEALARHFDWE